jgi:hypothetical protein
MKISVVLPALRQSALAAVVGISLLIASKISAQTTAATAEMERVIVTGSNIPSAEEVGPNPVDTYRPTDIEKLGVRNSTDFLTNLPQEMGTTINQNTANGQTGGDGAVVPNLRGLLPKETLVLIDGKRVAIDGFGGAIATILIRDIRVIRGQKSSVAVIFFVTRGKISGRNISERLKLKFLKMRRRRRPKQERNEDYEQNKYRTIAAYHWGCYASRCRGSHCIVGAPIELDR